MPRAIQAVRADGSDPKAVVEALNRAFEEFKAEHTRQLADVRKDVVQAEKVDRINDELGKLQAAIDETNGKIAAALVGGDDNKKDKPSAEDREYVSAFVSWFRTGDGEQAAKAAARKAGVNAAYQVGDAEDGGLTAPIEWDRTITDKRVEISPMRRYASTQTVTGRGFKKLYNLHGSNAGWVGETDTRPETNTSQFAEYAFSFGEIYANPAATQQILDDSLVNIEAWLAGEVNQEFSKQEGTAFVTGDGVNKPKGLLLYDAATEAALPAAQRHPLGPISEVKTGSAAALTADGLIDLVYDLPEDRAQGAALYANRKTHAVIRKMKDGQGNYLWQPPFQAGQPAQVLGYSINELSGLPDIGANAIPVVFGNMSEGYRIFDRVGVRILRDPYTKKPYVLFYTTKRVGGGLWNPEYLRYHRVSV